MSKGDNRLKIMYIIKELTNKSDENHYVKTSDLITLLSEKNFSADRKSIYGYIDTLIEYGFDIDKSKRGYRLMSRHLELAELKMLVDVLSASKSIPPKKSKDIIHKLECMTSEYNRSQLNRQVYMENTVKSENFSIIYSIDAIYSAIAKNRKITFNYYEYQLDWDSDDKAKQVLKKDENGNVKVYTQSPYALVWKNENYYLMTYDGNSKSNHTFRVDRMHNVKETRSRRDGEEFFAKIDISRFANTAFSMFSGEPSNIVLRVDNSMLGVIVDRFGSKACLQKDDAQHFLCSVDIQVSDQFFGWLSSFGTKIQLTAPQSLCNEYKTYLTRILESQG